MSEIMNVPATEPVSDAKKIESSRFIFILMLLIVFIMAARTPLDSDMWWHLRAGQVMVQTGHPMLTDQFSFTRMGQPWINHSWLSEIILYLIFSLGGYLGLSLLVALLATLALALVYLQMDGPPLMRTFVVVLCAILFSLVWSPRPQMFSLLLFALVGYVLFLYKWRGVDRLWWLVPIFVLWSNLHGGYALGFILLGIWISGELLNKWIITPEHMLEWKQIRKLAIVTLVCVFAVLINPNGINTWLIPFKTIGVNVLQQYIDEWASPDFHQLVLQPYLWVLFLIVIGAALSRKRMDGPDLVGILGLGYLGFLAKRNIAPFALFAGPVLARTLWPVLSELIEKLKDWMANNGPQTGRADYNLELPNRLRKGINLFLIGALALVGVGKLYVTSYPTWVNAYIDRDYPLEAIRVWESEGLPGNLLNSYAWGGYLDWAVPNTKVFVDGRTDLFGDDILQQWMKAVRAEDGWQDVLAQWDIHTVLLEPDMPLVEQLKAAGWSVDYQDEKSILLER